MLSVYAPTDIHEQLRSFLQQEDRLEELVRLADLLEERPAANAHSLMIRKGEIYTGIDWHNIYPPYLLPEAIDLDGPNFLGLLYARLNNFERCQGLLSAGNHSLYLELDILNRLQQGIEVAPEEIPSSYSPFEEYRLMHNQAIVLHYSSALDTPNLNKAKYFYLEALQCAPNEEYRAFTAQHFALLLLDSGAHEDADRVVNIALHSDISADARMELQRTRCQIWTQYLTPPYPQDQLAALQQMMRDVLAHYESQGRNVEQALLLLEAGQVAQFSENWSESHGCYNKALTAFEQENLPLLAAEANYRKGILLLAWAQANNPQFYRPAAESFQKAVQIFTREEAPQVYADIQHHLGIIYADIPDEVKKKSIWAGVSSSAFREALDIYQKDTHPHAYATVCNHYGNALTKYPQAKLSDNFEKALFYYQEALSIRTAAEFPTERCLILLNYLNAQWHLGMEEDKLDETRYQDMVGKAEEAARLATDDALREEAAAHLKELEQLRSAYA
jgi:hypothetical protein